MLQRARDKGSHVKWMPQNKRKKDTATEDIQNEDGK